MSYSRPDIEVADNLVSHLESHDIPCWIAPRDVTPGAEWAAEIVNAIAAAPVMVLIFSENANSSPHVRHEVERASDRGVRVLAFRIVDVQPAAALEYFLGNQQWVNAFPPPIERHYTGLVRCLNTSLAMPTNPAQPQSEVRPPVGPKRLRLEPAKLSRLETELAFYIGPFAKVAVHNAAAQSADSDSLVRRLSNEISSEAGRHKFIASCRGWLN